jgi:hypothetical protein
VGIDFVWHVLGIVLGLFAGIEMREKMLRALFRLSVLG